MVLQRIAQRRSALCSLSRCLTQPGLWSRGFASLPDPIGDEQAPVNSKDGKVSLCAHQGLDQSCKTMQAYVTGKQAVQ